MRTSCLQQSQLTATWRVKTGDRPPSLQHLQYLEVARRHTRPVLLAWVLACAWIRMSGQTK
jgi:hypothetical protein